MLATEANGFRGRDILAPGAAEEFFARMQVGMMGEWMGGARPSTNAVN